MRSAGLLLLCCLVEGIASNSNGRADEAPKPFGLQQRISVTTSKVQGRPEPPPPLKPERLYSKLRFKSTTLIDRLPDTGQWLVGELTGKVFLLPENRDAEQASVFLDCQELIEPLNRRSVYKTEVEFESLYATAFDPQFAENRYCYVCYVVRGKDRSLGQLEGGTRVSRFQVKPTQPAAIDVSSEEEIITWLQGGHNGGSLRFGLDGCLYVSSGDGGFAFPPDGRKSGQNLSSLLSKVLRIDVRRKENGRNYAIPADNPFVELPNARGETWCYGLRNPWKISIDRGTGDLWIGDVGWELWELVYRVNKGDNFGWSIVEGSQQVHAEGQRGPTPIIPATMEIPHTDGASITGGFVYRGKQFPELVGHYIFGDWETRRVWAAKVTPDGKLQEKFEIIDPIVRIVDFAEDRDGELYLLDHDDGSIFTLSRNVISADSPQFPRTLSDSGLFSSIEKHELASGVLPFSINAEQWSDGAVAERFVAIPGTDPIRLRSKAKLVPGSMFSRKADYPLNSVVCKTLSLDLVAGDPSSRRRIETQMLHFDGREWQGYTYEWSDDQMDAVLVERSGKNRTFQIQDTKAPGGQTVLNWRFSARAECIRCHNPWSEYTLAFNIPQLNRDHDFGGITDNQLRTYKHIGLMEDIPDEAAPNEPPSAISTPKSPDELPKYAQPFDESADLNARARSYLQANCAHCHRFNGGGSSYIYFMHELSLRDTKAVGTRPTQGTFGIAEAQVLAPGDPYRSVLYFRMSKLGPGHMPHLGAKTIDERGLKLIHDWIRQLPVRLEDAHKIDRLTEIHEPDEPANDRAAERKKLIDELLSAPPSAVMLAEAIRQQRFSKATHDSVLAVAMRPTTDPAIRDLFESFIPAEQRVQRLGDNIHAAEPLRLPVDLSRGRQLFLESTVVQCRSCHRVAGKGTELGPDLDAIGKKYDRAKLLESILQPSLQIDPKYKLWLVETKAGQVFSGLISKQDGQELILRDAQNKEHRLAMTEVEEVIPQTKSLMPEQLVRDFTAQQVADLLEFLSSLKADTAAK